MFLPESGIRNSVSQFINHKQYQRIEFELNYIARRSHNSRWIESKAAVTDFNIESFGERS